MKMKGMKMEGWNFEPLAISDFALRVFEKVA